MEGLEPRALFSVTGITATPDITLAPASAPPSASASVLYSNPSGYTPAQIRSAYGFSPLTLSSKSADVAAGGLGQTIAIVDAYNDPNIAADLAKFDSQFLPGGAPVSSFLKVVNQNGGSSLPATNAGWAGEISLDVEWAHAMAPDAKIVLVEANSAGLGDLLAGVNYARNAAGVSVVSMSWGGSEFSSESAYNSYFTTPAGHQGVTFVASAGDSGPLAGAQWPAVAPGVLSVGGTSLYLQSSAGTYGTEAAWAGSTGGTSRFEPMPAYQAGIPTSNTQSYSRAFGRSGLLVSANRSVPDVAYNADPNTGFAIYDSVPYQGYAGWQVVGGTSAGAPQWAALVAIADQSRALAGKGTLDGLTQTLPALYGPYSNVGATGYAAYSSILHDVTGGPINSFATAGYDSLTGLGTPRAGQVISILAGGTAGSSSTASTASTTASVASAKAAARSKNASAASEKTPSALAAAEEPRAAAPAAPGSASLPRQPLALSADRLAAGGTGDSAIVAGPSAAPLSLGQMGPDSAGFSKAFLRGNAAAAAITPLQSLGGIAGNAFGNLARGGANVSEAMTAVCLTPHTAFSMLMGGSLAPGFSSLLAAGAPLGWEPSMMPPMAGTLLNLAPALWVGQSMEGGQIWEIVAGVSLGVALAGYGFTTASERDERRFPKEEPTEPNEPTGLRRVPGGWELTSMEWR